MVSLDIFTHGTVQNIRLNKYSKFQSLIFTVSQHEFTVDCSKKKLWQDFRQNKTWWGHKNIFFENQGKHCFPVKLLHFKEKSCFSRWKVKPDPFCVYQFSSPSISFVLKGMRLLFDHPTCSKMQLKEMIYITCQTQGQGAKSGPPWLPLWPSRL